MASHEAAINTLLDGLSNRQLDSVLASNCVVDWFGRTFKGQNNVINFYQNSNASYEHSVTSVQSCEAFEERPYHFLTREQPLENLKISPDIGDEQWFDCETHSPVNLKGGNRTPLHKPTPARCPPAPCRNGIQFYADSDSDDLEIQDDDDSNISGVLALESNSEAVIATNNEDSPDHKKFKRNDETVVESNSTTESKFGELQYIEVIGNVTINRQPTSSNEVDKRECKLRLSYRVHNDEPSNLQIALIVYKSNTNTKTRRNLMSAFEHRAEVVNSPTTTNVPSSSRSRSLVKHRQNLEDKSKGEISTEPGSRYSKATKRPLTSKTSLRF